MNKRKTQNQHLVPTGTPPGGTYMQIKHEKNVNRIEHEYRYDIQVYISKINSKLKNPKLHFPRYIFFFVF